MTNVDQFESLFRAADKPVFRHEPVAIGSVLVVTDLAEYDANLFGDRVRSFLNVLRDPAGDGPSWRVVTGSEFRTVPDLLALIERERPDLICAYRHLHSAGWQWPFTLGEFVEVLTQATTTPVLVLPHPEAGREAEHALDDTREVMAITDHLAGADALVNWAAGMTEPGGTLFLTHVEDEAAFERMISVIAKVPELDTDVAREEIRSRLLREPHDYIGSCRAGLEASGLTLTIEEIVTMGRHLASYRELIEAHAVDLLVLNTKDEDQLAMHGLAHPLAVELRTIPLLML
jgi:hypothetical protein